MDARYVYMNPYVEFTVSKIVFYEILIMLGIKFIAKTELFTSSDTNLEFDTWPLLKKVGLLIFGTIRFFHFRYVQRSVNYIVY